MILACALSVVCSIMALPGIQGMRVSELDDGVDIGEAFLAALYQRLVWPDGPIWLEVAWLFTRNTRMLDLIHLSPRVFPTSLFRGSRLFGVSF